MSYWEQLTEGGLPEWPEEEVVCGVVGFWGEDQCVRRLLGVGRLLLGAVVSVEGFDGGRLEEIMRRLGGIEWRFERGMCVERLDLWQVNELVCDYLYDLYMGRRDRDWLELVAGGGAAAVLQHLFLLREERMKKWEVATKLTKDGICQLIRRN